MKKITDKDVEALKAGKKVTKGFIHMQLDDKGKLNLWSDINITDNYRSLKIDANKDGRPCKWVKDVHDEERDNYEFDECLEIYGFVRGCSSAVMILRPADDHGKDFNYVNSIYYQVFLTDSKEIIQHMIHGVIYGKWTFVKRGENFGIKLVKVLPGIHKCILRIAEKDIFGHESK